MIQNAAGCLVINQQICTLCPFFISLHCLPGAACIKYKPLTLVCKVTNRTLPTYMEALVWVYFFIPTHFIPTFVTSGMHYSISSYSFPHNNQETLAASVSEHIWMLCACIILSHEIWSPLPWGYLLTWGYPFYSDQDWHKTILWIKIVLFVLPWHPNL